jgi:hypothetical protein
VLRSLATPITLAHLSAEQTEALLRSVFSDVPNVSLIAGRIHALSQGNPRATMELAQHLVARGLARYSQGAWSLPAKLDEADLPRTLAESLRDRLDELSDDARALAEALCIGDDDHLPLSSHVELMGSWNENQVFSALDELVIARVLERGVDCYHFSQRGFLAVLRETMSEGRKRGIHARIAGLLARTGGDVLRRAHHLFAAQQIEAAIALLTTIDPATRYAPPTFLREALEQAEARRMPARVVHWLRMAILLRAPADVAIELFKQQMPYAFAVLERDSGLLRYRALADVPEAQRLGQALAQTQQQSQSLPDQERVHAVAEAIREMARLQMLCASVAISTLDIGLIEALPSLAPLVPLSPTLEIMSNVIEASRQWIGEFTGRGSALSARTLARISEPDRAGLDEGGHQRVRLGVHYSLGLYKASLGIGDAESHALVLEADRELRVNAWRLRQLLHLNQGDLEEAARCQRRAELLQLQEGVDERFLGTNVGFELSAYAIADDVLGIKLALEGVERLAARVPTWVPVLHFGRSRLLEHDGDLQTALEVIERGLELALPARHPYFGQLAASRVRVLDALGRHADATRAAEEYLRSCERHGLLPAGHPLFLAAALAFAREQPERAAQLIDAAIERAVSEGRRGLALGVIYEARARLALRANDRSSFERYTELCAKEFSRADNPALSAKLTRLLDEARQQGVLTMRPTTANAEVVVSETDSGFATVESKMRECVDGHERARCALTLLLHNMQSLAGYLYAVSERGVELLGGLPDGAVSPALDAWVRARVYAELSEDALATDDGDDGMAEVGSRFADGNRAFELVLLATLVTGGQRVAAAFVHQVTNGPRLVLPRALVAQVAKQLLDHGDSEGVSPTYAATSPTGD